MRQPDAPTGASRIDFNCDLGEGCGQDAGIVPWISSASIACGGHAGDDASMRVAIALCLEHGVAIGAHPSFEDRANFGRVEVATPPAHIRALVGRQLDAFASRCAALDAPLRHVKPHGALYNLAARDPASADAIVEAVRAHDPGLVVYALAGSALARSAASARLAVAHEVFAERRYEVDGSLTPRTREDAVIADLDTSRRQVLEMLVDGCVTARTGERVPIRADTLCLHGDRTDAAAFARGLHDALRVAGFRIVAPGSP